MGTDAKLFTAAGVLCWAARVVACHVYSVPYIMIIIIMMMMLHSLRQCFCQTVINMDYIFITYIPLKFLLACHDSINCRLAQLLAAAKSLSFATIFLASLAVDKSSQIIIMSSSSSCHNNFSVDLKPSQTGIWRHLSSLAAQHASIALMRGVGTAMP